MTRILVIVFLYGGGLLLFAYLVDKIFAKWVEHEERKTKILRATPNRVERIADPRDDDRERY